MGHRKEDVMFAAGMYCKAATTRACASAQGLYPAAYQPSVQILLDMVCFI